MRDRRAAEELTAADASNVEIDAQDQVNVFLLAGILGQGGFVSRDGSADLASVRAVIGSRLRDAGATGLRRFAQRVVSRGRRLVWEPCEPDLSWHVRQVEPVAGREGLAALCAGLMATPLPTDRPLWELLIVPGVAESGPGIVLRVHHAVADGVAGVRLARQLFDRPTSPEEAQPPTPAGPRRTPWASLVTAVARLTAMFRATVPPTALLGAIGPNRGVVLAEVDLARLKRGASAAGGTLNDALLAAVAAAAAAILRAAGEAVPPALPASVPVALPDRGGSGNAVGVMLVPLPTGEGDAAARVRQIARLTSAAKDEARAQGTYELTRTRWGSRLFAALARRQRFIAVFVTNVRGPAEALHLAGAPLEHAWPVAPIQGNVRLGVAAFSYAGRLSCAAHLDAAALDHVQFRRTLADELERIAELG